MNSKYTWGDSILIKSDAPTVYRVGSYGSVCGMRLLEADELERHYDLQVSQPMYVYTVEYADGTDIEIPEQYLEIYPEDV
jgi:hypothetical protein